jgi:hypothetical protein
MIALTPEQRQSVEQRFRGLAIQWAELTAYCSNVGALRNRPVYQELISLGEPAVPLILEELARKPSPSWFGILGAITGENPVSAQLAGHVEAMAGAWIQWGRRQGYLE